MKIVQARNNPRCLLVRDLHSVGARDSLRIPDWRVGVVTMIKTSVCLSLPVICSLITMRELQNKFWQIKRSNPILNGKNRFLLCQKWSLETSPGLESAKCRLGCLQIRTWTGLAHSKIRALSGRRQQSRIILGTRCKSSTRTTIFTMKSCYSSQPK